MTASPPKPRDLKVEMTPISSLKPASRNARRHSKKQVNQIGASFAEFGVVNPIIVDEANIILAGHGRVEAAKSRGMVELPVIRVTDLTDAQKRAYRIADNRLAELAEWDFSMLAEDLKALCDADLGFDVTVTGFEMGEIDVMIGEQGDPVSEDEADRLPAIDPERPIVTKAGDLWALGKHKLLCGNALELDDLKRLLDGKPADMVETDAPFNARINGHVCGKGAVKHAEFAMASGEMSRPQFRGFLNAITNNLVLATREGSVHFLWMDWRHIADLIAAGMLVYDELLNLCVWNKSNGGMGSLYRSKHELVAVFRNGPAPHINNVQLGRNGRNRTNVWDCPGANSFGSERDGLAIHPTVKPVKLIEDTILDCSNRGDAILDAFCGSGTTLIAAERAGRRGFGLEIEPKYVDVALRRFRNLTGEEPVRSDGTLFKHLE